MLTLVVLDLVAEIAYCPGADEGPRGTRTGVDAPKLGGAPPTAAAAASAAAICPLKLKAALGASALRPCSGARKMDPWIACNRHTNTLHQTTK